MKREKSADRGGKAWTFQKREIRQGLQKLPFLAHKAQDGSMSDFKGNGLKNSVLCAKGETSLRRHQPLPAAGGNGKQCEV